MQVLRTPDERFADLPDFPYAPRYVEVDDGEGGRLRVAYVDEGPADGETVLLMHGEPTWSFLYRRMIPVLVDAGLRVVAPDLVGFGRSDKPTEQTDHTYARHVGWMRQALLDQVGLRDVTLVCQDWGGLIGLRLVAEDPDRFARVVAANTGLPTGDQQMPEAFLAWQKFSRESPRFEIGPMISNGSAPRWRPRWSRPTTRPSRTTGTPREPGCCPRSCPPDRTTLPPPPTGRPGRCCPAGRSRS